MANDNDFSDKIKDAFWGLFFDEEKKEERITKKQQKEILKLAQAKDGILSVSEVVLGTSLSMEEAEKCLQKFSAKGYAQMNVTDAGAIVYEFQGLSKSKHTKTDPFAVTYTTPSPTPQTPPVTFTRRTPTVPNEKDNYSSSPPSDPLEEKEEIIFKPSETKTSDIPDWMKKRKGKKW